MSESAEEDLSWADEAPNIPMKIGGSPGVRPVLSEKEQLERKHAVAQLLQSGVSNYEIERAVQQKYGMSREAVRRLRQAVLDEWNEQDDLDRPSLRAQARRRHLQHIRKAAAKDNYSAVANLEKNLMAIEGTAQPVEQRQTIHVEHRIVEGVRGVLGELDEEQMRAIIADEKRLLDVNPSSVTLDTDGVSIDEALLDETTALINAELATAGAVGEDPVPKQDDSSSHLFDNPNARASKQQQG